MKGKVKKATSENVQPEEEFRAWNKKTKHISFPSDRSDQIKQASMK